MNRSRRAWERSYNQTMRRHGDNKASARRFRRFGAFRVWVRIKGRWWGLFL